MSRALLEADFAALNARDGEGFAALFTPDVRYEVPQTGEVVGGPVNVAAFDHKCPGEWSIEVRRALADEVLGLAETQRAVVVHEDRDGLISRITDCWPGPYDPPAFRAGWPETRREE
ncbi:nuclear transport factor 2 family protein [Deinococcus planocerae]|uniref:nuclear transport factor 2 family protein n=1 Tax=Deinococcus planocerae TaxID=1737569 RepID=UPI000C7F29E5|nr:nuclear transport factor 2 family protein [Deinococcus planocerae]